MRLVDGLPKTTSGCAIGNQPVCSGTSVGANYRAPCRGRSKIEFIAKLGIVVEDAEEFTAIFVASVRSTQIKNPQSKIPPSY